MKQCADMLGRFGARFLVFIIRLYQLTFSHLLGGRCRFIPSCSQYAIEAIEAYGPIKGAFKALFRLLRCHPFGKGGYQPPLRTESRQQFNARR